MPIYEFKCRNCKHVFEELVFSASNSGEDLICPKCGAKAPEKLMSACSSFGGSGSFSNSTSFSCGSSGFS